MREIWLSATAESDLVGIWRYTLDQWGRVQADQYLEELEQGISQLSGDAGIGVGRGHVRTGYRVLFVNRHAVYYKVNASQIRIIRVLHGRMDPDRKLPTTS